jgi:hypothetical protein
MVWSPNECNRGKSGRLKIQCFEFPKIPSNYLLINICPKNENFGQFLKTLALRYWVKNIFTFGINFEMAS